MLLLQFLAFSYYGALRYYTIDPIHDIADSQLDTVKLRRLLYQFKIRKKEEAKFVQVAVKYLSGLFPTFSSGLLTSIQSTLSAAAIIGIFSWPSVQNSFWLSKTLWYSSLYMSIFALISSASGRLLAFFPDSPTSGYTDTEVRELLNLMLAFPHKSSIEKVQVTPKTASPGSRQTQMTSVRGVQCWRKVFFWQHSTMLMSWSWGLLLVGLTLHILTPWIMNDGRLVDHVSALLVCCVILAVYINFFICGVGARRLGCRLREKGLHESIDPSVF